MVDMLGYICVTVVAASALVFLIYLKNILTNISRPVGNRERLRVAFVHPDLGIGGAERLIVDAALAFSSEGHYVHIYTSHHDPGHCFKETKNGTIPVTVRGDGLPRQVMGRFHAVFAYLRMCYVSFLLVLGLDGLETEPYDIVVCDQVSACIPILRLSYCKILFYCHFPDKLLMTDRESLLKKIYRYPLDMLEEFTTGQAHRVVVNSEFTRRVFREHFPSLNYTDVEVLYPSINFSAFDSHQLDNKSESVADLIPASATRVLLSINRFEKKKNVKLALQAFLNLRSMIDEDMWCSLHMVIAGGYDSRVRENVEYYEELCSFAEDEGINEKVTFLRSFSDAQKIALLNRCTCLLYTPDNEHFGIGPLEAMYMERMVIAVASGGPLETVDSQVTGRLCDLDPAEWARAIMETVLTGTVARDMGVKGKERVIRLFSFQAFTRQLVDTALGMI
eukprot:CFRG6040T1